uniref:Integrase catalytic domain-containing protein n=1 Tax=Cacopsylla melanoneura TaxID=428564 RepID=A0A8D8SN73_9HEMI
MFHPSLLVMVIGYSVLLQGTQVKSLSNLRLADDTFDTPGQIHGLLGAAFYPYIVLPGNAVDTTPDGPRAINTTFGYVVIGNAKSCSTSSSKTFCGFVKNHQSLEYIVKRFWEDEEVPSPQNSIRSKDELEAEAHFKETCTFDKQVSRYIVRLPFKKSPDLLGNSVNIAKNRFLALERKLERNPRLKDNYTQAINELLVAEHLIPCPNGDETDEDGYYVPHHCIVKESSLTTKYRIVFDFSCRTSNGVSLNDLVYSGPKLYTDLFEILLNFRLFEVALVADVARMFLQVLLHPEDTKYQKIFWRKDSQEPLQTYFLSRVTFGLSTSPFLVQRVIHQLAMDKAKEYPLVKPVIESAFYMDDLTLSLPTTEHALEVQHQLIECFKSANFDLVKWSSNNPLLLESIPPTSCLSSLTDWNPDESLKILGMYWNNNTDQFSFGVTVENSICTKRNVLSNLAKIWDPLGLISPVTVHCKILLQSLWKSDLSWDSPAPQEIADIWTQILRDLQLLSKIQIPRHIAVAPGSSLMLIGYCDASEKAFGAVIYSRVHVNDKPVVTLLAAKSKVAPLKQVSIPRLELNAALLLARLLSSILNQYTSRYPVEEVVCLSDSTIALHWINASPHKWQTYVANRVTKIQELIPSNKWYHVTTHNNTSADCLSRGLLPSQLLSHPTWFAGPPYLIEDQSTWPITTVGETTTPMPEEKNLVLVTVVPKVIFLLDFAKKYSSWSKILHILVYVYRFLKVLTTCSKITIEDLKFVELKLLLAVQDKCFGKDFQKKYASLSPFKDDSGLIRVGGRLSNSNLPFENKHPILLPKEEYITRLLVVFLHETNLHTGPALLLAIIRQKYWILAARPLVRQVVHECNLCFKIVPHNKWPKMGDLPRCRVEEVKPWVNTGVDHAGPFTITLSKHRGNKTSKAYLCLFVCLTTTAIHLEVTSDLSKEAFLNALKRFLSRRGPISTLFSDNGGAFVASKNHLNELYSLLNSSEYKEYFGDYLLKSKIQWKMLPARAPHMGGIWERAVRKVKSYLPKLIGDQILTFEEICTVAIEVEGMINATPLCVLSSDPNELEALTPAHFIKLTSLQSLPAVDVSTTPLNRLTRYKLLDNIFQNMWKRYRVEYLTSLQERSKWRKDVPNIEVGTVVLLKEDNVPAMHWPLGIVVEVFPSKTDGIVRSASVKTKTGIFKRPVVKLCPLPTQ